MSAVETVHGLGWRRAGQGVLPAGRIYLGHETCERRLPEPEVAVTTVQRLLDAGRAVSLVLPSLTDSGLDAARRLLAVVAPVSPGLEVVCNDWGLLDEVRAEPQLTPALGRLLAGQEVDPRLAGTLDPAFQRAHEHDAQHLDGTTCRVVHRAPPLSAVERWRQAATVQPRVLRWLHSMGVSRAQLNLPLHGLKLPASRDMRYTLVLSDVLVSMARYCHDDPLDFASPLACDDQRCDAPPRRWLHPSLPTPLYQRANAVFALHRDPPAGPWPSSVDRLLLNGWTVAAGCHLQEHIRG